MSAAESSNRRELKSGSALAAREFVARHAPAMLQAAERILRSRADAEDAVQEAFINAWRKLESLPVGANVSAWLHRVTINAAITLHRKRRRASVEPIDDLLPQFTAEGWRIYADALLSVGADDKLMSEETATQVRAAIDRLPEAYRVAIVLRDLEDLTTREAAEALGLEENALKVRLHRGRAALRALLEPLWLAQRGNAR